MFDEKKEITKQVESLLKLSGKYSRGQLIPWSEIEAISGDRTSNRGRHIINRWRRRLERDKDINTLCENGTGIKLLTHQEATDVLPNLHTRKARRSLNRCLRKLQCVDQSQISDHSRRLLATQTASMKHERRNLGRIYKLKQTATNPMRPQPAG